MHAPIRPEAELLLGICGDLFAAGAPKGEQRLLSGQVDWPYLIGSVQRNGIIPIVGRWLDSTVHGQIPPTVKRELALAAHANELRNAHLSGELVKILGSFSESDIDALAVKGPVLAALLISA